MTDTTQTRWSAQPDYTGWYIADDQRWDDRLFVAGSTKEQAEYGAMVLNEGGLGDIDDLDFADVEGLIADTIEIVRCSRCEMRRFRGEVDADVRCPGCQS